MDIVFNILTVVLLVVGVGLMLVASYGSVRMPSTLLRMSATTKASTMGAAALLLAAALHFREAHVIAQVVITLTFLLVTAPVAAHIISRAGFKTNRHENYPMEINDLKAYYEQQREEDRNR